MRLVESSRSHHCCPKNQREHGGLEEYLLRQILVLKVEGLGSPRIGLLIDMFRRGWDRHRHLMLRQQRGHETVNHLCLRLLVLVVSDQHSLAHQDPKRVRSQCSLRFVHHHQMLRQQHHPRTGCLPSFGFVSGVSSEVESVLLLEEVDHY